MLAEPLLSADRSEGRGRRQALFLELLSELSGELDRYVRSLVLNRADADDVLQDVCVTLWTKFDQFEFGTSFRKWAFSVAFHVCRAYWRDRKRRRGVALGDDVLAKLSQLHEASREIDEIREQLLDRCLEDLSSTERTLVREVYFEEIPTAKIAERRGLSANAVYIRLTRLRKKLARCLDRRLT